MRKGSELSLEGLEAAKSILYSLSNYKLPCEDVGEFDEFSESHCSLGFAPSLAMLFIEVS